MINVDVIAAVPVSSSASVIVFSSSAPTTKEPVFSPSAAAAELLLKFVLKYAPSLVVAKSVSTTFKSSNPFSLILIFKIPYKGRIKQLLCIKQFCQKIE